MAMAIRHFGKVFNLAIHLEFGHSLILAIRWSEPYGMSCTTSCYEVNRLHTYELALQVSNKSDVIGPATLYFILLFKSIFIVNRSLIILHCYNI